MNKLLDILSSWRFWAVVFISVIQGLKMKGAVTDVDIENFITILQMIAGGAVGIRTIDRIGDKSGLHLTPMPAPQVPEQLQEQVPENVPTEDQYDPKDAPNE